MTIIARCKTEPPQHDLFVCRWQQPYLPGDEGLDWYVTTGGVARKVQRDRFDDDIFHCKVRLTQGTTDFVLEDGAHTTPSNQWTAPNLTGLKLQWDGHETPSRCRHEADLTDTTHEQVLRDGHLEHVVERFVMSKIVTQGSGSQLVGTPIIAHHAQLFFRADAPDVVEIVILISNAAAEMEVQGQGIRPQTAPTSTAFTNCKLILPAGWDKLVDRPLAEEDTIPAPVGLYTSNAHCVPRKMGTVRRWFIYRTAASGAFQQALDLQAEYGHGRATAAGPRSFHSVRSYGPMRSVIPDLDDPIGPFNGGAAGMGSAGSDAQSLQAFNNLQSAVSAGSTGGGGGGDFGESLQIGRMGLFHPIGEFFPGAPAGLDIEVYSGRRYTRNHIRFLKLYTGLKVDRSGIFLFNVATGAILRSRDFGDAYTGSNVPGFVSGPQFAGRMPFQCQTQNDSGYEYKVTSVQTFGGWTPRSTSWPPHFLENQSATGHMYKKWWPIDQSLWGTPPRSLWDFKCNYRPILEQVPVPTGATHDSLGAGIQPTYFSPVAHFESSPTISQGTYTAKDPSDTQHAIRIYAKLIALAWHTGDPMAVKLLKCFAEWFAFEYTEVGTLDVQGTDSFTIAQNNKSLVRRLEIQQSIPHTAHVSCGRADAWAGFIFAAEHAVSTPAERNDGYPTKGLRKRCEMMMDFIGTGLITINGLAARVQYPGGSGADRAFGFGAHATDGPPIPPNYDIMQAGLELPKLYAALYSLQRQLGRSDYDQYMMTGFQDYLSRVELYSPYSPEDNGQMNGQVGPYNFVASWNTDTNQPQPGVSQSGTPAPRSWFGSGGHWDDVSTIIEIAYRISGNPAVFTIANYLGNQAVPITMPARQRSSYWVNGTGLYGIGLAQLMRTQPGPDVAAPLPPAPTFASIQPASALAGAQCRIFGTGFSSGSVSVTIGGLSLVNLTLFGDGLIVGQIPALSPGHWDVVITTGAGQAIGPMAFEVLAPNPTPPVPVITSITPTSGTVGELVTILGTGFGVATWSATIDGQPLTRAVRIDDSTIRGQIPSGTVIGSPVAVAVTTPGGTATLPSAITVHLPATSPPVITSVTPIEGPAGTQVSIAGIGFSAGVTSVKLGGVPLDSVVVSGDGLITAAIPAIRPGTYALVVTTSAGSATLPTAFMVVASAPVPQPPTSLGGLRMTIALSPQTHLSLLPAPPSTTPPSDPPSTVPPETGAPTQSPLSISFSSTGDQSGDAVMLTWVLAGGAFKVVDGDLQRESGLAAAVLLSLFSDARVSPDPSRPITEQDLRGWWGEVAPDRFGSELWRLERAKATADSLGRARDYAKAALQWMIDAQIARDVQVQASYQGQKTLVLQVLVLRGNARRWARLWNGALSVQILAGDTVLQLAGG